MMKANKIHPVRKSNRKFLIISWVARSFIKNLPLNIKYGWLNKCVCSNLDLDQINKKKGY